jgi:hypothetical protein
MSFNFGPTLLSWLDRHASDVTEAIGRAEREGRERYSGHGPAIAHEETIVVEIYDGPHYPQKPSWYTDERDAH